MIIRLRIGLFEVGAMLLTVAVMLLAHGWATDALMPTDRLGDAQPHMLSGLLVEGGYSFDAVLPQGRMLVGDDRGRRYVCALDGETAVLSSCAAVVGR